jgi:hypothetical protein
VPQLNKLTIMNGPVPTVSYSVPNGSPHVQALASTLQFTENEIAVTNELQKLRLGMVINEQTLDTVRTSQALGLGPISTPSYAAGCYGSSDSLLKRALIPQLAQASTPAMAFQLINLREQLQTVLQAEQNKAQSPQQGEAPVKPEAPPVAPPAVPQQVAAPAAAPPVMPQQVAAPQVIIQAMPQVVVSQQATPQPSLQQQVSAFQDQVRQRMMDLQQTQTHPLGNMGFHW